MAFSFMHKAQTTAVVVLREAKLNVYMLVICKSSGFDSPSPAPFWYLVFNENITNY